MINIVSDRQPLCAQLGQREFVAPIMISSMMPKLRLRWINRFFRDVWLSSQILADNPKLKEYVEKELWQRAGIAMAQFFQAKDARVIVPHVTMTWRKWIEIVDETRPTFWAPDDERGRIEVLFYEVIIDP